MPVLRTVQLLVLLGILVGVSACTAINSGVGGYLGLDTDLLLSFRVEADVNPDERDKPSPLFIRLYELKSTKMINNADFIDIYERDKEVLGADLLAKQKLKRLTPGEARKDSFVLDPNTRYIALYAEFLQYKDAEYRVIIPVVPNNVVSTKATVHVSGNSIKIIEGSGYEDEDPDSGKSLNKVKKGAKASANAADKAQGAGEKMGELF
jgi:type VI secretion system protein VasD